MNRVSKNQGLLLLTLVVLWIGLLIWQFDHSSEQARAPLTHVSGQQATGKTPAVAAGGELQVHLERLATIKGQREATFSTPRNIFASLLPQVEPVAVPPAAPRRGRSRGPAKAPPATEPIAEESQGQITAEEEPEPVVEGPKGPTPEEIERLRIATELNQYRYVGFMAVGGGSQKKKNMAVVVHNDQMHGSSNSRARAVTSMSPKRWTSDTWPTGTRRTSAPSRTMTSAIFFAPSVTAGS